MTQHERKNGTVTVPEHEWPRVHYAVLQAWNAWQDEQLLQAQRLRAELAARYGGQGETALWRDEVERLASRAAAYERSRHGATVAYWRELAVTAARDALLEQLCDQDDLFPPEPDRTWFPHAPQHKERFAFGEASLTMDHASRTLTWSECVGTRDHAMMHSHPVGMALSQVQPRAMFEPEMEATMSSPV